MISIVNIALVVALLLGAALLVFIAERNRKLAKPFALAALAGLLVLGIHHTGGLGSHDRALFSASTANADSEVIDSRCAELVGVLRQNAVVSDDPEDERRIIVEPGLWNQIPNAARDIAVLCLEKDKGIEQGTLEVAERN